MAQNTTSRSGGSRGKVVSARSQNAVRDRGFLALLESLEATIASLDEKKSPMIQEILAGDWLSMSGTVIHKVEYFLSELLVVRPIFCRTVTRQLISRFVDVAKSDGELKEPTEIPVKEQKIFAILHRNLRKIFESFPTLTEHGVKSMSSLFPYMTKGPHLHYCYVSNLLNSIGYMPDCKMQILRIIIHRLGKIDANIPAEDVEALSEHLQASEELSQKVKLENGGMETIEFENYSEFTPNPLIVTLDVCLNVLFEFVQKEFSGVLNSEHPNNKVDDSVNSFHQYLKCLFEKEILPSLGTQHIQFIFFYLTSLQSGFSNVALESLWEIFDSVNNPQILRIQAMSYISGFLARAKFISFRDVKRWLTRLADWANAYVIQHDYDCRWITINLQAHGCFYAICQTIFYVIAFHNKQFLGSRKASTYVRTLNLGRLVVADLNPLKACNANISEAFVEALNYHEISYLKTIVERNQRATIPTLNSGLDELGNVSLQITSNTLETFFPFDNYLLPRTKHWIDPIYNRFDPYIPEVKIEKKEDEDYLDGVEMELSNSFSPDSVLHSVVRNSLKNRRRVLDSLEFMDC